MYGTGDDTLELVPRRLKAIGKCKSCKTHMKNEKKYIPFPMSIIVEDDKRTSKNLWFGINKQCKRCGHVNIAE